MADKTYSIEIAHFPSDAFVPLCLAKDKLRIGFITFPGEPESAVIAIPLTNTAEKPQSVKVGLSPTLPLAVAERDAANLIAFLGGGDQHTEVIDVDRSVPPDRQPLKDRRENLTPDHIHEGRLRSLRELEGQSVNLPLQIISQFFVRGRTTPTEVVYHRQNETLEILDNP